MLRLRNLLRITAPRWALSQFSLVSFADRSFDGRSLELEWLGFKLLIAIGRLPKDRTTRPRRSD